MGRLTSRRRLGKGRTEHERLVVTVPNTARKSGSGIRQPAEKLNNSAWSLKLRPNSATKMKRGTGNIESMTI
jgi:hypothetical protein